MRKLNQFLFNILDENNEAQHPLNKPIGLIIMFLIILSVLAVILESEQTIADNYKNGFYYFEVFAVTIFTFEYLARILTAHLKYPDKSRFGAIVKYIFTPMALIDLLAILPFYLEIGLIAYGIKNVADTRFLRVLRLMRLLRLFKLNRYNNSMKLIGNVMREEKEKLFITLFMVVILLVLSAALIFTFEHEAQPEAFPNIYSSMWWAIATLTTVGYGDVFPVTGVGKMLAGFIALLGIGLVALPTGILASSFVTHLDEDVDDDEPEFDVAAAHGALAEKGYSYCPHCGEKLED